MRTDVDYKHQLYQDLDLGPGQRTVDLGQYIKLLGVISERKRNVMELADASGIRIDIVSRMIATLKKSGYVIKIFGGNARYTILSTKGEEVLRRLGE